MRENDIVILEEIKDIKKEVAFWMDVLNNEHVSKETKKLAEQILQNELKTYLYPPRPPGRLDEF